jgi:hypothetical protein
MCYLNICKCEVRGHGGRDWQKVGTHDQSQSTCETLDEEINESNGSKEIFGIP